jgi:hypothetical protein
MDHELSLEIDTEIDEGRLERIVLAYAKQVTGHDFQHVFFDIKKNMIKKVVVYSNIKPI